MSTFLEICRDLAHDLGVSGAGTDLPSAVQSQTGDLARVVRAVAQADVDIAKIHMDWKFMWESWEVEATDPTAGTRYPAMPETYRVRRWDYTGFRLVRSGGGKIELTHQQWPEFRKLWIDEIDTPSTPYYVSTRPDNVVILDRTPSESLKFVGECWKHPQRMLTDTDTPNTPEGYSDLIKYRAGVLYGINEDVPNIVLQYPAMYDERFADLEAEYLPGGRYQAMSEVDEILESVSR